MSQQQYVTEFETTVRLFNKRGIKLDDNLLRVAFMKCIVGICDPNSSMFTYYNLMCVQPIVNKTFAFVKQQFLNTGGSDMMRFQAGKNKSNKRPAGNLLCDLSSP